MLLLTSIGTAGDIHPYVAIALALKRRGHHVVLAANPYFQERILAAGVGFWPVGSRDEYLRMVRNADLVTPSRSVSYVFDELLMGTFMQQVQAVQDAWQTLRPEAVIAHHICFGSAAACERLGIPLILGVLAPLFWLSSHERIIMPTLPLPDAPGFVHTILRHAMRPLGRWMFDRPLNAKRRSVGAPPIHRAFVRIARGGDGLRPNERISDPLAATPALGLWSPHFRPARADDPAAGHICGFCFWDRPPTSAAQLDQQRELERWMDDGQPPVLVTLGSSVSHHGRSTYDLAARACARLGRRALLLTGEPIDAAWPEGIRATPYAAYSAVMPRAAAIVHHAGIGTAAAAMRAGVPSVILPFANDEFDNVFRARALGVAVEVRHRRRTVDGLARAIDAALTTAELRARARDLGDRIRAESGAETAADAIERVLNRRRANP